MMNTKLFQELYDFKKKSKIKAGDGLKEGLYPFFTSSDSLSKRLNSFLFDKESLIFGTGGKASIHFIDDKFSVSTDCFVCQPYEKKEVFTKYVYYYLNGNIHLLENGFKGAGLKHISKGFISNLKIPLPPLTTQKKIATILDKADQLRQLNKELIKKYDELRQSLFLDMFGDPVTNPKNFKTVILDNISEIVSGVTKGRKLKTRDIIEIPYMRVANVQDGYLNINEVKTIPGTKEDIEKYSLQKGDVLLTEGGDPDKLGRGAVWNNEIENCIHQNHIFRVRLTSERITSLFLSKLAGSNYGKRYFLKSGKQTTGIASINKTQLKKFPVLLPSIELQLKFQNRFFEINKQMDQANVALQMSEELFHSLLQKAFNGELVS